MREQPGQSVIEERVPLRREQPGHALAELMKEVPAFRALAKRSKPNPEDIKEPDMFSQGQQPCTKADTSRAGYSGAVDALSRNISFSSHIRFRALICIHPLHTRISFRNWSSTKHSGHHPAG